MAVRQSLLAILGQGPCYGYQLGAEFDRRTGSTWPLNVGQIYNTLDRLERDGLVTKGTADEHGHVYYRITEAGSAEVADWIRSPVERAPGTRDELALKIAVAATLPGVDVAPVLDAQRRASLRRLHALRAAARPVAGAEALARALVLDSMIFSAEAELRWVDQVEQRLARHPGHTMALEPVEERPRRGRPARDAAPPPATGESAPPAANPGDGAGRGT